MGSLIKKRKVITWLLIFLTVFQCFLSSFATNIDVFAENENANDRLSNSIKLAKGKSVTDIDTSQLNEEELMLIGTYLSNFYIPLSTELGGSTNDKTLEKAKANMVDALTTGGGFDKGVSEALVETIWTMTMESAQPLYIGELMSDGAVNNKFGANLRRHSKDINYGMVNGNISNKEWREKSKYISYSKGDIQELKATYLSFMDFFSGLASEEAKKEGRKINDAVKNKDICLYYVNTNGERIPVFDTSFGNASMCNEGAKFTASSLSYCMLLDNLNYLSGIGSNLTGVSSEEAYKKLDDGNKNKQAQVCAIRARLYVDCFGNILVDFGTAKFVLVPACANPYCWYTQKDKSDVGKNINLVNLFMLGEADNKNITADEQGNDLAYKFKMYHGNQSLFNLDLWRTFYGKPDTEIDWDMGFWKHGKGGGEDLDDLIKKYMTEWKSGANSKLFYAWSTYNTEFEVCKDSKTDYKNGSKDEDNLMSMVVHAGQVGLAGAPIGIKVDLDSSGYATVKEAKTNAIDDFILFDSYNTFRNSKDDDYSIFNLMNEGKGGILTKDSDGKYTALPNTKASDFSKYADENRITTLSGNAAKNYMAGIYCSYALAFYNDFSKDNNGNNTYVVNYAYNKDYFPKCEGVTIDWSNIVSANMDDEIKSMIYYFLHPSKGITYVATWFKNKVSGILVKWHEDMVGNSSSKSTTGSTKYIGFSGYVTLPTLTDIKWTAWLLDEYNNIIVYLIIIIFVILIAYCIVGNMTFQRAILGVLLFGILAFFPPLCINATVNVINNTCDSIYGDKFTYWALVQHQTFIEELNEAASSDNKNDYLVFIFQQSGEQLDTTNYARVRLKWISPKKISVTADAEDELKEKTKSTLLANMVNGMLNQQLSGQTFLDNEDALYLYRDYADIYNYMVAGYNTDGWYNGTATSPAELRIDEQDLLGRSDATLVAKYSSGIRMWDLAQNMFKEDDSLEYTQKFAMNKGFITKTGDTCFENRSYSYLLDSGALPRIMVNNRILMSEEISSGTKLKLNANFNDQNFGLGNEAFRTTLAKVNGGVEKGTDKNTGSPTNIWSSDGSNFQKDDIGTYMFGLYTESPFYFFAYNLYDQQNSDEFRDKIGATSDSMSSNLLDLYTMNNQEFFYNYNENSLNGFGELKDFTNMRALFYYVIPYLKACNEGVLKWSDVYGTFTYDDVRIEYDAGVPCNFPTEDDTDEYIYKWWHNYNVERLFNTYSAWVDLMYSCDYAKHETITVLGEKYIVEDPLDPTSYFQIDNKTGQIKAGRMMVFSRSEMKYYGLELRDLTEVEQKIIKVQDETYKSLLQLMDYFNFDNDVLVTSAGMMTTFNFNKEFSQTTPFGENYILYPQSYELKAFTYDAYLRLILAESTGEDLMDTDNTNSIENNGNKSYYQRIVEKSSITTGIGFIVLDILAVYAIPALKLFFLIAIFFMSVLMIIAAAIKIKMNIVETTWNSLIFPLLKFGAVSIGLAWVVSLFMSDGNTAITNRGGLTISLGDPAMVVLVMIIVNIVALILYYKICKASFKKMIEFAQAVGTSISGAVGGALGKMAGIAIGGKVISDSIARGTAKARGLLNKPFAKSSKSSGSSDKDKDSSDKDKDSRDKGKGSDGDFAKAYDNLTKKQGEEVAGLDEKAKAHKNKYNELCGGNYTSKADEISIERRRRQAVKESNIKAINEKKSRGEKLTLSERMYSGKCELADLGLSAKENTRRAQGKVVGKFNDITGRTRRAKAKADMAEREARATEDFYRNLNTERQVANQRATRTGNTARVQARNHDKGSKVTKRDRKRKKALEKATRNSVKSKK